MTETTGCGEGGGVEKCALSGISTDMGDSDANDIEKEIKGVNGDGNCDGIE